MKKEGWQTRIKMLSHDKTFIFNFYQMLYLISQQLLMVSMDMKEITKE